MGDLYIDYEDRGEVQDYKRSLDLEDANVRTEFTIDGEQYTQEVFASAPDDAIIIKLASTNEEGMNFNLRLDRPKDNGHSTVTVSNPSDSEIAMVGEVTQYGGVKDSKPA